MPFYPLGSKLYTVYNWWQEENPELVNDKGEKSPRPYLRAEQRREQLMQAAASLVGQGGWEALKMAALAEAAGVSRQLVYEHFKDLDTLHLELTRYFFEEAFTAVALALREHPDDLPAATRTGFREQLSLPRGARLALRELTCGPAAPGTPLERLRAHTRRQVTDLWALPVRKHTALDERRSRALAWMMNVALWGLLDLVDDGTLSAAEAEDFYVDCCLGAGDAVGARD